MAKKAAAKKAPETVEGFPESPYGGARIIEMQEQAALRQKRLEALQAREANHPHLASNMPGRPDLLAIPDEYKRQLEQRGLMAAWIVERTELQEYLQRGYQIGRADEAGELQHDYANDRSEQIGTPIRRREMILVVFPKSWQADRFKEEQRKDAIQRDVDPNQHVGTKAQPGRFGKGARRADPQGLFEDDDSEFMADI